MISQQKQRVEHAVTEMIDDMDKNYLRKMQVNMHKCAARCCEDIDGSIDSVQRCVDRCSQPLVNARNYVTHELNEFQGRLERCIMQCNDDIKIKMSPDATTDEIGKFTDQFDRCAVKCVDKHVGLIPTMMKTMKAVLAKGPETVPQF